MDHPQQRAHDAAASLSHEERKDESICAGDKTHFSNAAHLNTFRFGARSNNDTSHQTFDHTACGSATTASASAAYEEVQEQMQPPIDNYGIIGNMRTSAHVGKNGSIDWFCYPYFSSPSVFARILDMKKGGFFSMDVAETLTHIREHDNRQHYWPDTNILITKFLTCHGVGQVIDFMPVLNNPHAHAAQARPEQVIGRRQSLLRDRIGSASLLKAAPKYEGCVITESEDTDKYKWIVRRIEVVQGKLTFDMKCLPAFNYARDEHTAHFLHADCKVVFISKDLCMTLESSEVPMHPFLGPDGKSVGAASTFEISESTCVTFVFREATEEEVKRAKGIGAAFPAPHIVEEDVKTTQPTATATATTSAPSNSSDVQNGDGHTGDGGLKKPHLDVKWTTKKVMFSPISPVSPAPATPATPTASSTQSPDNASPIKTKYDPFPQQSVTESVLHFDGWGSNDPRYSPLTAVTDWLFVQTMEYWHNWIKHCNYQGRWREHIFRSALALKLMMFEPTGAIVAAPTTSLPEHIGGTRNWDYRYTWLRDSAYVIYSLIRIGFYHEAESFMNFLEQRCKESIDEDLLESGRILDEPPLKIMYPITSMDEDMTEVILEHLDGYRNSKPVRIGNGAADQLQLDIYGELMDAIYLYNKYSKPLSYDFWRYIVYIVNWVCAHCDKQDDGVWEVRGRQQHFVYSKVLCWVAIDRGLRLADRRSFPAPRAYWQEKRDGLMTEIMKYGYNKDLKAFTQSYSGEALDASVLIMPLVLFVAPNDPRMLSTIQAINRGPKQGGLTVNSLVYRYDVSATDDGFEGEAEGAFLACTMWLVEALARTGDRRKVMEAQLMLENFLTNTSHLGLLSEEMSTSGFHLGNHPQAFSHLGLISAVFNVDRALNNWRPMIQNSNRN